MGHGYRFWVQSWVLGSGALSVGCSLLFGFSWDTGLVLPLSGGITLECHHVSCGSSLCKDCCTKGQCHYAGTLSLDTCRSGCASKDQLSFFFPWPHVLYWAFLELLLIFPFRHLGQEGVVPVPEVRSWSRRALWDGCPGGGSSPWSVGLDSSLRVWALGFHTIASCGWGW